MDIFRLWESHEEFRPSGSAPLVESTGDTIAEMIEACKIGKIMLGDKPVPDQNWCLPQFILGEENTNAIPDWDYYMTAQCMGLLSIRAAELLQSFWSPRYSMFPVSFEGFQFNAIRCDERLDYLEKNMSDITYYTLDDGKKIILCIDKYVFNPEAIEAADMFSIPEEPFAIFCTQKFVDATKKHGLKGFYFEKC